MPVLLLLLKSSKLHRDNSFWQPMIHAFVQNLPFLVSKCTVRFCFALGASTVGHTLLAFYFPICFHRLPCLPEISLCGVLCALQCCWARGVLRTCNAICAASVHTMSRCLSFCGYVLSRVWKSFECGLFGGRGFYHETVAHAWWPSPVYRFCFLLCLALSYAGLAFNLLMASGRC